MPCLPSTPFMFLIWHAVLMGTTFWGYFFGALFRIQKGGR